MSISVNWGTKVVTIPKADLTHVSGVVYSLDVNDFHLSLKDQEASADGMSFLDIHKHTTETELAGVTYARFVEIINGYTVTFEDSQYAVKLTGANNNIADVANVNQVSIRSNNSAGLIHTTSGSGVTEQDKLDIADRVWDEQIDDHLEAGSTGNKLNTASSGGVDYQALADAVWNELVAGHTTANSFAEYIKDSKVDIVEILKLTGNKVSKSGDMITIYEDDGVSIWRQYDLSNGGRERV